MNDPNDLGKLTVDKVLENRKLEYVIKDVLLTS